jgi:hypothetical protein
MPRAPALLLAAAAFCLPGSATAQAGGPTAAPEPEGRIEGHVTDAGGGPLADVAVSVVGGAREESVSNSEGRFTLRRIPVGAATVRLTRIGYATRTVTVHVRPGGSTRIDVVMPEQAIELAPLTVSVAEPFLDLQGFYRRAAGRNGRQYSREQLDDLEVDAVSDVVRSIPGVIASHDPQMASRVIATRPRGIRRGGTSCALTVFVDGIRALDHDINQVPSDWLVGVEVYLGAEAPAEYRVSGGCGAVLLWTKQR